ncbi:recombinase family protein [Novosphingobium sp. ZN18A2]|uniref:recombinase family protein n=1 Tax=Novosphingobium sp. ZN18A2 TaxID=3079861 RepID=UPI0030D2A311
MTPVRCAIYTRKSSDEGLEQGFNSLDAQREACAAYVMSQASEGWELCPEHYDDGGISGGTLERPALKQLLADMAAGKIDIIVVYKVDRLTRSLLDFAKLVEALDKAGTSFVSITQSFNTATSMGRLTLNMLLSFAQFEREVTAERIRDKIAASKAKGMWMGGIPPLGYEPDGRSLKIVEDHAALIRDIHARYRKLGAVRLVADQLVDEAIRKPLRNTAAGKTYGGGWFSRGQLYAILRNPIYAGYIAHHGKLHRGAHKAIIAREEWDKVQKQLDGNGNGKQARTPRAASAPLAGLLVDEAGEPLVATHTRKGRQRYTYYVSKVLQHGTRDAADSGMRIPAREIEDLVTGELTRLIEDPIRFCERTRLKFDPDAFAPFVTRTKALAEKLGRSRTSTLRPLLSQVRILPRSVEIALSAKGLRAALDLPDAEDLAVSLTLTCNVRLTRTGRAVRLVHDNGVPIRTGEPDPALLRLLMRAREWWAMLAEGEFDVTTLARREGVNDSYLCRVVRLAFLSPQVVDGIVAGKLKPGIDITALLKAGTIQGDWVEQGQALLR